jgi:hypothetical protein
MISRFVNKQTLAPETILEPSVGEKGRRTSSVSIVTGVQTGRARNEGWIPSSRRNSLVLHNLQTGSGAEPASCPVGTMNPFPGDKSSGHEADHSPASGAKLYTHSLRDLMALCLI